MHRNNWKEKKRQHFFAIHHHHAFLDYNLFYPATPTVLYVRTNTLRWIRYSSLKLYHYHVLHSIISYFFGNNVLNAIPTGNCALAVDCGVWSARVRQLYVGPTHAGN